MLDVRLSVPALVFVFDTWYNTVTHTRAVNDWPPQWMTRTKLSFIFMKASLLNRNRNRRLEVSLLWYLTKCPCYHWDLWQSGIACDVAECVVPGRGERGEMRRQMVQNIIDISVLKAEIPGNTLPLSLSPDLCTIQKPPRSKYKFNFTLYLPRERERERCENCTRGHSEPPSHGLV